VELEALTLSNRLERGMMVCRNLSNSLAFLRVESAARSAGEELVGRR
jgi:hypothetical protein